MPEVSEWIERVDALRAQGGPLASGEWHGYLDVQGDDVPMRGRYYLMRWKVPTVAVSHDDPEHVIALARAIEGALSTPLWRMPTPEEIKAIVAERRDHG